MAKADYVEVSLDVSAVPAKPVGAGRYTYELAHQLSIRGGMRPLLIARKDDEMRWEALPGSSRVHAAAPSKRPLRLMWEQTSLPKMLSSIGADVHHGPHYTLPGRTRIPTVVTIHDMTFFDHPEWHEKAKVTFFKRAITKSVKQADGIVAVSADTGRRLQERFGELDVTVIPHGVDHTRFRPDAPENDADARVLQRLGIEGPFIGFVGMLEPRKDLPTLIAAFDRLAGRNAEIQLVLAGKEGWHPAALHQALENARHRDRIVLPGFVPDAAVPALYRQAAAVAYPSLTEGFGLPALEALACGAPLVTTSGSAMEEVVDDAALLIEPGDTAALANALHRLLNNEDVASGLRKRGPQVAAAYTWGASADAHIELYRKVAKRS